MKRKVYIAGKITGDNNYKSKFDIVKKTIEAKGYIVLSPAELPEGMSSADYMRLCFAMIDAADEVAFLPDYGSSDGASIEHAYCLYIKKDIVYFESPAVSAVSTKTAEWIFNPDGTDWNIGAWQCSNCGSKNKNLSSDGDTNPYFFAGSRFCPHCGLPMQGIWRV